MWPFFYFQYGFRSSRSTADLMTAVSDRIARAFKRSAATRAVALDISKAFNRAWHFVLLHKLGSYRILGQIFDLFLLFSVISGFRWFWMESLFKNIRLMLEFLKVSFFVLLHLSYYKLMTFLMMLSVLLLLIILLSTLNLIRHLTCGNNHNWFLNLNLIYEMLWTGAGSGLLISMLEQLN